MTENVSQPGAPLSRREEIVRNLDRLSLTAWMVRDAGDVGDVEREMDGLEKELAALDQPDA
jgi:hypothetical protein